MNYSNFTTFDRIQRYIFITGDIKIAPLKTNKNWGSNKKKNFRFFLMKLLRFSHGIVKINREKVIRLKIIY